MMTLLKVIHRKEIGNLSLPVLYRFVLHVDLFYGVRSTMADNTDMYVHLPAVLDGGSDECFRVLDRFKRRLTVRKVRCNGRRECTAGAVVIGSVDLVARQHMERISIVIDIDRLFPFDFRAALDDDMVCTFFMDDFCAFLRSIKCLWSLIAGKLSRFKQIRSDHRRMRQEMFGHCVNESLMQHFFEPFADHDRVYDE